MEFFPDDGGMVKQDCIANTYSKDHVAWEYYKAVRETHRDVKSFAYFHLFDGHDSGQMSKGSNVRKLGAIDKRMVEFLEEIEKKNDTVVILASDHGSWIVHNRPFFHMLIPESVRIFFFFF